MNVNASIRAIALAGSSLLAVASTTASTIQQSYVYDALGRLTDVVTVSSESAAAGLAQDEHYKYDKSGNMVEKTLGGETARMSYDQANQLVTRSDSQGTVHFDYDNAGRLVTERQDGKVLVEYTYGYLDKVMQTKRGDVITKFHYNAAGMLVAKERDGKIIDTFAWDGLALIAHNDTLYVNEPHASGGEALKGSNAKYKDPEQHLSFSYE